MSTTEALQRISDMDPNGERADDLGRAARVAREALAGQVATPTAPGVELAQTNRMFLAACEALGSINEALGLDPEDGGAEPILGAIEELQARAALAATSAPAQRVYLVATGETHEGEETYTRHDVRPPLCDAELLLATSAPSEPAGWVSVSDRLPEKNNEVLVAFAGQMSIASTGQYTGSKHDHGGWCYPQENFGVGDDGDEWPRVTHWMSLPDVPGAAPQPAPAAPVAADPIDHVPRDLMSVVEQTLDVGHLNTEDLARLRAAWEQAVPVVVFTDPPAVEYTPPGPLQWEDGDAPAQPERMPYVFAVEGVRAAQPEAPAEPSEPAPPNSLPDWDECAMRVANSDFIDRRVSEGGYGPEHDTKLATQLHRFIYEYDDADPYRSAWFLRRLELLLNEVRATPPAEVEERRELSDAEIDKLIPFYKSHERRLLREFARAILAASKEKAS